MKALFWSFLLLCSPSVVANEIGRLECGFSEKVIFLCEMKERRALLCESRGDQPNYRYGFGSSENIELKLPVATDATNNYFRLASHPTLGGSISYIHFSNRGYDYYLIDDSSKKFDGSFSPFSELIILKGKKIVRRSICENDDSGINKEAYNNMARELYAFSILKPLEFSKDMSR